MYRIVTKLELQCNASAQRCMFEHDCKRMRQQFSSFQIWSTSKTYRDSGACSQAIAHVQNLTTHFSPTRDNKQHRT